MSRRRTNVGIVSSFAPRRPHSPPMDHLSTSSANLGPDFAIDTARTAFKAGAHVFRLQLCALRVSGTTWRSVYVRVYGRDGGSEFTCTFVPPPSLAAEPLSSLLRGSHRAIFEQQFVQPLVRLLHERATQARGDTTPQPPSP